VRVRPFIIGFTRLIYRPENGRSPDHIAVDETVIQLNDEQYWLYAAVDPETNELLHTKLRPTTTKVLAHSFLTELTEKHDVSDAVFLVRWLAFVTKLHVTDRDSILDTKNMEIGTLSNVYLER
jgi:Transposase and inactivated derivatives